MAKEALQNHFRKLNHERKRDSAIFLLVPQHTAFNFNKTMLLFMPINLQPFLYLMQNSLYAKLHRH
jgi:hypothetical protein